MFVLFAPFRGNGIFEIKFTNLHSIIKFLENLKENYEKENYDNSNLCITTSLVTGKR